MLDRGVRANHCCREEALWIGEPGLRLARELRAERVDRDFGGDLAVQMAAEAVGDDHQQRLGARPVRDAILVHAPRADARFLGDGELHFASSAFCSAWTLCGRSS